MANVTYYLICEKRLGKKTNDEYFLYDGRGWIPDERNVIRDHLMGYDPNDDTPYGFGSLSIKNEIEEISRNFFTLFQRVIKSPIISDRSLRRIHIHFAFGLARSKAHQDCES